MCGREGEGTQLTKLGTGRRGKRLLHGVGGGEEGSDKFESINSFKSFYDTQGAAGRDRLTQRRRRKAAAGREKKTSLRVRTQETGKS